MAKALPIMQDIFADLERMAGLALNKPKCILIPLWPTNKKRVTSVLARHFPYWADMAVDFHGTYLGVVIGPGSGETILEQGGQQIPGHGQTMDPNRSGFDAYSQSILHIHPSGILFFSSIQKTQRNGPAS